MAFRLAHSLTGCVSAPREATNLTGMRVRSVVGPAVDFVRVSGSGLSPLADPFGVAAPFGGSAGQDAQVGLKARFGR